MKKKLSFLLLSILVLPVVALLGCDKAVSIEITASSSSTTYGSVSGNGTYSEGSTITLTATPKGEGEFVAWVFQYSTELESDDTYTIEKPTVEDGRSTLTFTVSNKTKGNYTAVFDKKGITQNSKMMYVKLSDYRITTLDPHKENNNGTTVEEGLQVVMAANMYLEHGQTSNSTTEVLSFENQELKNDLIMVPEKMNQVLKLSTESAQHIHCQLVGKISTTTVSKDFRTSIEFQKSSEKFSASNYSSQVTYSADGTYQIVFEFESNSMTYYLVLNYKTLSAQTAI